MNWYKKAQATTYPRGQSHPEYTDIGHMNPEDTDNLDQEEYLWIWTDGKIDYRKAPVSRQLVHGNFWDGQFIARTWSGRFDLEKDQISIGAPFIGSMKFRPVPDALISQLHKIFSPSAEIWFYGAPDSTSSGVERLAQTSGE